MRQLRLLNLLASNAKRAQGVRAQGNTIFLYGPIVGSELEAEWFGGVTPEAFIRELSAMTGPVALRINSPGGEVFAARAMAQHMREYGGEITAIVDGLCASAATFLAATAAKTVMAPGAMYMIHKAGTLGYGNADDMRSVADLLDKIDVAIAETYAAKTGKRAADFGPLMAAETWYSDAEAVAAGLADEVAGEAAKVENATRWDLSAYEHPPAAIAADADPVEPAPVEPAERDLTANPVRDPSEDTAAKATAENERRRRITAARLLETAA
jgi:ATP-dependent Clp protease protease subunit